MSGKPVISIATSCYNECENIRPFYDRCLAVLREFPDHDYEFVVSDNCSTDGTRDILREIAAKDPKFRVILNAGNVGHIRSPYNAIMHTTGDAVFCLCSDLQEPPELLREFMAKRAEGYKVVCGVRSGTRAGWLMEKFRSLYYYLLAKAAPGQRIIPRFTGFGLYDREVIEALRRFHEPYPYFRGLLGEVGFKCAEVEFVQAKRLHGRTKNNFFTLYDMAMTGFVNHSMLPLRLAAFLGFLLGAASLLVALVYLVLKLVLWDTFSFGMAPLMIGMFFFGAIQLIFIGILGEYIGAILVRVKDRLLAVEEEKLNFPPGSGKAEP